MTKDTSPPAFARAYSESDKYDYPEQTGMSLLDYFAAAALTGVLANYGDSEDRARLAAWSYAYAESMIAARNRLNEEK